MDYVSGNNMDMVHMYWSGQNFSSSREFTY